MAGKTANDVRDQMARILSRVVKDPDDDGPRAGLPQPAQLCRRRGEDAGHAEAIDDAPMTLVEALNRAEGVLNLTGDNSRARHGGQELVRQHPCPARQGSGSRIMLRSGDIVRVEQREDSKVFVTGEVVRPVSLLMRNGRMSLQRGAGRRGVSTPDPPTPSRSL
ncbi:hypothetical protein ACU4GD_39700 [Cupriavidus basilensis]